MKYFIYTRKSTDSEERQVLSIEAQLAELQEFAAKEKLEIVASLCEAQTAKEPEKMSARILFWPEAGFSLFCLIKVLKFGIIILKELPNTITLLYYQIIENMANEINIGENIKKHRTKQKLSQEDFARKSGVKYTTLTKIESNVIKKPSVLIMAKIAKALGVNIEDLIK